MFHNPWAGSGVPQGSGDVHTSRSRNEPSADDKDGNGEISPAQKIFNSLSNLTLDNLTQEDGEDKTPLMSTSSGKEIRLRISPLVAAAS